MSLEATPSTNDTLREGFNATLGTNLTSQNGSAVHHKHHHHPPGEGLLIFYGIMISILGAQSALVYWKQRHQRSYELVTLVGLWLIPAIISVRMSFWRFILVWLAYTAGTGFIIFVNLTQKRMAPSTPRRAYMWFLWIHQVCVVGGVLGYATLTISFVALPPKLANDYGGPLGLLLTWYCLYFGILNRDCAEVAANRMAMVMGSGRRMAVSVRRCGICDGELKDFSTNLAQNGSGSTRRSSSFFGTSSIQLPQCKHIFHDGCIRGWTLVGKKDTCPTCLEKVDLRQIFSDRPWETRNLSWIKMLDALRYLVCWMPIILVAMHFILKSTGLEKIMQEEAEDMEEQRLEMEAARNASLAMLAAHLQQNASAVLSNITLGNKTLTA